MSTADSPQAGGADAAGGAGAAGAFNVAESIIVGVPPAEAYQAVSDVRRMARWSPECFAVLVWSRKDGLPARFVGLNRRGPWVWFTTCQVVTARPGEEFAFDVTTFGMPVSRWDYRLTEAGGGTEVTESWRDQRGRGAHVLGRIFTGKVANNRAEANRAGMRTTLARLKRELEAHGGAAS
jgi:Polyketide cyclase / dehydrase and lipid transport